MLKTVLKIGENFVKNGTLWDDIKSYTVALNLEFKVLERIKEKFDVFIIFQQHFKQMWATECKLC